MTAFVALLRGINVGRNVRIGMADLRTALPEMGLLGSQTLLQSGNIVFQDGTRSATELERSLEALMETRFGRRIDCFVRTAAQWQTLVARNPFEREARADPARVVAIALKDAPAPQSVAALQGAIAGRELVRTDGRTAYIWYGDGIGRSRLTHASVETMLATRGTARNWNTVLKLGALSRRLAEN